VFVWWVEGGWVSFRANSVIGFGSAVA
jgi:hypothetical protein